MTTYTQADWHHYAIDKSGALIQLKKGSKISREDYFCIGCGKEVRPVMGDDREWHFRHKEINPECNHESWLHSFAKRYFKQKFESEEPFVVSYWAKEKCLQYDNCELRNGNCCKEELHELDLKLIYDVCEEEKTNGNSLYRADLKFFNSKDSKTKPLFLEIAYTHDCEPEKIASGIQILEIKIEKEEDLEKPIVEPRQLMLDYQNGNPYSFCQLPNYRFYNFDRVFRQSMSTELRMFVVAKNDKNNIIHGPLGEKHTIGCDKVDNISFPSLLYLLFVPAIYIKSNPNFNLWSFGLMKAFSHNIIIRNCFYCRNCYAGRGGCVRYANYMANLLDVKDINKDEEAQKCSSFQPLNGLEIKKVLSKFGTVPHKEIVFK